MRNEKGFTLIELLLVVMIIGFMLAIILPRGLRATTDAKYNLTRQNSAELAAFANDWIEQQILAQDEDSVATRADYLDTLVARDNTNQGVHTSAWIADSNFSNWNTDAFVGGGAIDVIGRNMDNAADQAPENAVQKIIEPAKVLRNPFNGADVFNRFANYPSTEIIPGAIACVVAPDSSTGGDFDYYAFIFQGTDSTLFDADPGSADFHGGMTAGGLLPGARQGVFFTKVRQN